jgi:peptidyl-prolyl cis-trans isomerase C
MLYKTLLLSAVLFFAGCSGQGPIDNKQALLKVNDYSVTRDEFEREFADSPYAHSNTLDSRKQFLEILINRKIILQEAERQGLDKEPDFLRNIERFWEQALLKSTLDRMGREIVGRVRVTDAAVEDEYKRLQAEGKADKPLTEMFTQIKWELSRAKESQLLDEWLKALRGRAVIKENLDLLNDK